MRHRSDSLNNNNDTSTSLPFCKLVSKLRRVSTIKAGHHNVTVRRTKPVSINCRMRTDNSNWSSWRAVSAATTARLMRSLPTPPSRSVILTRRNRHASFHRHQTVSDFTLIKINSTISSSSIPLSR